MEAQAVRTGQEEGKGTSWLRTLPRASTDRSDGSIHGMRMVHLLDGCVSDV